MLLMFPQKHFIRALVLIVGVLALLSIGVNFLAYSMTGGNSVLYVCAGMVYVGGAIGIETLTAMYAVAHGENNFTYRLISTLEETFEMLGLVIFLNANLHYFRSNIGTLTLKLSDSSPEPAQERSHILRQLEANR